MLWNKYFLLLATFVVNVALYAQTGPGGVGNTAGTSSLKLWYRVDNGVNLSGSTVSSWTNSAGISVLDISETGTNRPTRATGPNGYYEISFNGSNKLTTDVGAINNTNFVTNQASSFVVSQADNTTQESCVYTTDPLDVPRFSNHIPWSGTVYFDIGDCCNDRIQTAFTNAELTNYAVWSYDGNASGKQLYRNGTQEQNVGVGTLTYGSHGSHRFNIGGFTTGSQGFQGDITEVIIFTTKVNTAQRYIIQNYLAAKYGLALSANDYYTMDNAGNGNYDHDVAGIGRADASNTHTDSRGTGIVRIFDPTDLNNNGEYFFWGHDNGALESQTSNVPGGLQGRFTRVWRGQEVGTITNLDIEFDLTDLGPVTASHLRLLIDTDGDGSFSDETPGGGGVVSGASAQGSNIYRFANVTGLTNATNTSRRFTLGTTNIVQTPLPITLLSFDVKIEKENNAIVTWSTAQEINNDYFTIERSHNGLQWEVVKTVPGSGNSKTVLTYEEIDENPLWGLSYYRLKQTDFDGTATYSKAVSVIVNKTFNDVIVHPVPATNHLMIEHPNSEKVILKLSDELGREYSIFEEQTPRGTTIPTSNLPPGIYVLYISNGREHCYKKIVIE